jgi:hypothetical protein
VTKAPTNLAKSVAQIAAARGEIRRTAEAILMARAAEMDEQTYQSHLVLTYFSSDELSVFATVWPPRSTNSYEAAHVCDREAVQREFARCFRIYRFQRVAGTSEDRKAAQALLDRATQRLAERGPVIGEQIQSLERELAELETAKRTAEVDVENRATAVARLRLEPPADVEEEARNRRMAIQREFHDKIAELETSINPLRALQRIDLETGEGRNQAKQYAQLHPEAQRFVEGPRAVQDGIDVNGFRAYTRDKLVGLSDLEAKHRELLAARDAAIQEAEQILDYYAR